MIRRITLENFMSHRHTVLELGPGLTVLSGPNNCGKSAVVAALETLCRNTSGAFMVRHGERECVVTVETGEGHTIQWRRKGGTVSYRLNGRDVHRLRGSVPDELHELLRMPPVESEGDPFDIHFGQQKEPIFLLGDSARRRATFFASSSDAVKLLEMQTLHRRRVQDAKVQERDLARRETELEGRLEALSPTETLAATLAQLETQYQLLGSEAQQIVQLRQLTTRLERARRERQRAADLSAAATPLAAPPVLADTAAAAELGLRLEHGFERVTRSRAASKALLPLQPAPSFASTEPLRESLARLQTTVDSMRRSRALGGSLDELSAPPPQEDTAHLAGVIEKLAQCTARAASDRSAVRALDDLSTPPELADIRALCGAIANLNQATRRHARSQEVAAHTTRLPEEPPQQRDTTELRRLLGRLERAERASTETRAVSERLAALPQIPPTVDASPFPGDLQRIVSAQREVAGRELQLQQAKELLLEAEDALRHAAEELETCPLCGQRMDGDHLLAAANSHAGSYT